MCMGLAVSIGDAKREACGAEARRYGGVAVGFVKEPAGHAEEGRGSRVCANRNPRVGRSVVEARVEARARGRPARTAIVCTYACACIRSRVRIALAQEREPDAGAEGGKTKRSRCIGDGIEVR